MGVHEDHLGTIQPTRPMHWGSCQRKFSWAKNGPRLENKPKHAMSIIPKNQKEFNSVIFNSILSRCHTLFLSEESRYVINVSKAKTEGYLFK